MGVDADGCSHSTSRLLRDRWLLADKTTLHVRWVQPGLTVNVLRERYKGIQAKDLMLVCRNVAVIPQCLVVIQLDLVC